MKSPPLNVRYVLLSDYATIDHAGKLIVAGLYTEDLVVPSVPTMFNLVITVLAEQPETPIKFDVAVVSPSGLAVMGGSGEVVPQPSSPDGSRPRAILGFQFNQAVLPEGGDYTISIAESGSDQKFEIHKFRLIVNSKAHAEATKHIHPAEPQAKRTKAKT